MPKLPRSTSSATSSMASGTIPSRPAKPHPDRLKIMHLSPDRPLRLFEHAGRMGASEPEVAHDPERPGREAEAPVEGRFQGPALRGHADPAGRLVVLPLSAQLSRHRGAVPGAGPGGRPLHPEPLGSGLRSADRAPA